MKSNQDYHYATTTVLPNWNFKTLWARISEFVNWKAGPQVNSEIQYLIFLYKIVDYCVSWLNIFMIGSEIETKIGSHFYGSGL